MPTPVDDAVGEEARDRDDRAEDEEEDEEEAAEDIIAVLGKAEAEAKEGPPCCFARRRGKRKFG